jgi:hypothetical protein
MYNVMILSLPENKLMVTHLTWFAVSPSKVRGDSGSLRRVTAAMGASHEVKSLFRVLSAPAYPTRWVSWIPPCRCCFQIDFAVFLPTPAPGHFRFRVHPLVSLLPLQSPTRWNLHAARAPCAFLGVPPSFATSIR